MKKIGSYLLLLSILFTACSKDENGVSENQEGKPIQFSIGIKTRAAIEGNYFPENSQVGIFGLITDTDNMETADWEQGSNGLQENLNNGKYTATAVAENNTQELIAENIAKFPYIDNSALVFYAYYPYDENVTLNEEQAVEAPKIPITGSEVMEETPDYVYSGAVPAARTQEQVPLKFDHAMARMDIKVKKQNDDVPDAIIHSIKVVTKNGQKGLMSLIDGVITEAEDMDDAITEIIFDEVDFLIDSSTDYEDTQARFLIIPSDDAIEEIILTIKRQDIDSAAETEYEVYVRTNQEGQDEPTPIEMEAGKITTLNLRYSPREVYFTTEINDWEEEHEHDFDMY